MSYLSLILLLLLSATGPLTDMLFPAKTTIVKDFNTNITNVNATISLFVFSYAIFQLVYGPVSDRYGRKKFLILGMIIYFISCIIGYLATSIEMLFVSRFIQGVGSCAGYVLSIAMIKDIYDEKKSASLMSLLGGLGALVPVLGGLAGGYLLTVFHWKANFIVFAAFGFVCLLGVLFILEETNKNPDKNQSISAFKNYLSIFKNKQATGYLFMPAFIYGALFSYLAGAPYLLMDKFGLSSDFFGITYTITMSGVIFGGVTGSQTIPKLGMQKTLLLGTVLSLVASIGLLLFGFQNVILIVFWSFILSFSIALINPSCLVETMSLFPKKEASVTALISFLQFTVGAATSFVTGIILDTYGVTLLNLAFIVLLNTLFLPLLYYLVHKNKKLSIENAKF